ncbi:unnamed protein product [Brassica napus]|uniref:(rape) hypothetical protein n=1 Tax=Brassica napus TaxID=3708 RepID=A0A816VHV7_BRANA|nr:unnamed protein product [Brassica napus]
MKLGLTLKPFFFFFFFNDDVISSFLLTILGTRNERNQSTNRFSTASRRIPIRALDRDRTSSSSSAAPGSISTNPRDRFRRASSGLYPSSPISTLCGCLGGPIRS